MLIMLTLLQIIVFACPKQALQGKHTVHLYQGNKR